MKRLMILGGSRYAVPVIKAAHDLGAYVITADYLPDNYAHRFSDEYCNVSIVEKDAVLEKAREYKIDGITSFACDPGVVTAAYVAEQLGLPSCGKYESVCILQNKGKFRKFLLENGFNSPKGGAYRNVEDAMKEADSFKWPVIVKPTDSAGSKGVKKVDKKEELKAAIEYALSFSLSKEFIIEEFIAQKGFASDTDSFVINGELRYVSFNSQRFDAKAENPYTPAGFSWPSSMPKAVEEELTSEIQRLVKLLDMKTSIYNIETREGTDGRAYIMECSPRGGGNRLAECLEYSTGIKLIENTVRAALGMDIIGVEQKPYNGYWAEVVLHGNKPGIFEGLWIDDTIRKYVYEKDLWVEPGTQIGGFSAANESIGTLILRSDDMEEIQMIMKEPSKFIKVLLKNNS